MNDALKGPRLKIERAHEHIRKIQGLVNAAFSGNVYTLVEDVEPETGDRILKIRFAGTIPDEVLMLTAETAYHLRSALDQLAVALVIAATGPNADTSRTYFPFAGDVDEFQSKGTQRKIQGMSAAAADLVRGLKPYKGGNDVLWGISRLSNIDKHTKLVPIGTVGNISAVRNLRIQGGKVGLMITGECRLDKGIPVSNLGLHGTIESMSNLEPNFQVSGTVALGDIDVFADQPVVATLLNLAQLVERVVTLFESHV